MKRTKGGFFDNNTKKFVASPTEPVKKTEETKEFYKKIPKAK